jgi:hypothetical protein
MKRPIIIILTIILAFILGWLGNDFYTFLNGMKEDNFADYQLRPKNVPREAFWAGGVDGGNWYIVKEINRERNRAKIEIYNDQDGSLLFSKLFILVCSSKEHLLITDLKKQINGFDGHRLYLKDANGYCYLE